MIAGALAQLARIITGASVHWVEDPPVTPGAQRVYFGNHSSHLDFVVIWSALPPAERQRTRPVAGADYWERGRIKRYLARKVFRAILIERATAPGPAALLASPSAPSSPASQASATLSVERIASGMGARDSIIVFPEGTRTAGSDVLPFKSGLFHLCSMKPELELVPVHLANMNRILPKGEVLPVPLLGRVVFGPATRIEPGEQKGVFLDRMRNALLALRDQ